MIKLGIDEAKIDLSDPDAVRDTFRAIDADVMTTARELNYIVGTAGWKWLCHLIRERRRDVGICSLQDTDVRGPRGPKYWRGYLDGACDLDELVAGIVEMGKEAQRVDDGVREVVRPGQGGVLAGE